MSLLTIYDDLMMNMVKMKKLNSYMVTPFFTYVKDNNFSENDNGITPEHPSKLYFKNRLND
jgi:hypothetical protein